MKKRLQKMLAPNSVMFYVLFFLFAVVGLYFSRVYGAAGVRMRHGSGRCRN